jgi:hypothetical protein
MKKDKYPHVSFIPLKEKIDDNTDVLWWTIMCLAAIATMLLTSIEVTGGL